MANEKPGQTLQATALVHEAWIRLAGSEHQQWRDKSHFFGAAAEAMRRILIDRARRKQAVRHVGLDPRISNYVLLAPGEHLDLLVCRDCGSVSEVEDAAAVRELEQCIAARSGFSVLYHELEFYGTCPGCQRSKSAPPRLQSSQSA